MTTCCSYSRRLAGVSGTTLITRESATRWKVRPTLASAFRACSNGTSRRSRVDRLVLELRVEDEVHAGRPCPAPGRPRAGWRCGTRGPAARARPGPGRGRAAGSPARGPSSAASEVAGRPAWRSCLDLAHLLGQRLRARRAGRGPGGARPSASLYRPRDADSRGRDGVRLGGAQPGALQRLLVVEVVGIALDRPRVLEHRAVVVVAGARPSRPPGTRPTWRSRRPRAPAATSTVRVGVIR